jgi:hypothetical protein
MEPPVLFETKQILNSSLGIRGAPLAGKLKQSAAKQRGD